MKKGVKNYDKSNKSKEDFNKKPGVFVSYVFIISIILQIAIPFYIYLQIINNFHKTLQFLLFCWERIGEK